MKLDLDNDNVIVLEVSTTNIRAYFSDNSEIVGLEDALDNAQGSVFTGENDSYYLVLKVVP